MPTEWHIAGEEGRGWGAAAVPLAALNVAGGSVSTGSWDADRASLRLVSDSRTLSGLPVPDLEQRVELRRGASADAVHFRGWVTGRRVSIGSGGLAELSVEISGAWYWMRKAAVVSATRHQHALAAAARAQIMTTGDAGGSIATISGIAMAAYPGRIAGHGIGPTYELPRITISDSDTAAAVADLLRWLPDASAWWDYPASRTGNIFRLARRAALPAATLALDASSGVVSAEFNPRADLANSGGVAVDYAEVVSANTPDCGRIKYLTQTAGGGRVRVTAAGPELDTYLPDAPADSTTLTSQEITAPSLLAALGSAELKAAGQAAPTAFVHIDGLRLYDEDTGQRLTSRWYRIVSGEPKDWLPQRGISTRRVVATVDYWSKLYFMEMDLSTGKYTSGITFKEQSYSCPIPVRSYSTVSKTFLAWANRATAVDASGVAGGGLYRINGELVSCPGITVERKRFVERLELRCSAVEKPLSSATYWRPPDFDFVKPPAGLAASLAAAQDWTPLEGQAVLAPGHPGPASFAGKLLSVAGGPAEWASSATPVAEHTIDLATGRETVRAGAPARLGHLGIHSRIRRGGQDNIVWL